MDESAGVGARRRYNTAAVYIRSPTTTEELSRDGRAKTVTERGLALVCRDGGRVLQGGVSGRAA